MLELVPDCPPRADSDEATPAIDARPTATIHYIYDPFNAPRMINAITSVARRLQEVLIEHNALPEGGALPFPELAPANYRP